MKEKKKKMEKIDSEELAELKKKAEERDEFHAKWLNVHAEYENTRKRMERERIDNIKFANEGIIQDFFRIVDNFDMALQAMEKAEDKAAVMDGIKMVQKEFHRILEDNGVENIKIKEGVFDPNFHEAVMAEETNEAPEGNIIEVVRAGYLLNGRLLRPAQVKVAKQKTENREQGTEEQQ